jgi:hypothetical protein
MNEMVAQPGHTSRSSRKSADFCGGRTFSSCDELREYGCKKFSQTAV